MTRLLILLGFIWISAGEISSQNARLKTADSVKIVVLYKKAFNSDVFSQVRQAYLDSILLIRHDDAFAWQQKSMPLFKQKKYEVGMPLLDSAVKYDRSYQW